MKSFLYEVTIFTDQNYCELIQEHWFVIVATIMDEETQASAIEIPVKAEGTIEVNFFYAMQGVNPMVFITVTSSSSSSNG